MKKKRLMGILAATIVVQVIATTILGWALIKAIINMTTL